MMRGREAKQASMVMMMSPAGLVPTKHPLRELKTLADAVLVKL